MRYLEIHTSLLTAFAWCSADTASLMLVLNDVNSSKFPAGSGRRRRPGKLREMWHPVMTDAAPVMARCLQRICASLQAKSTQPAGLPQDTLAILQACSTICSFLVHANPPHAALAENFIKVNVWTNSHTRSLPQQCGLLNLQCELDLVM